VNGHVFDEDGYCLACHFDAADWHYSRHQHNPPLPMPACTADSSRRAATLAQVQALAEPDLGDYEEDWQDAA